MSNSQRTRKNVLNVEVSSPVISPSAANGADFVKIINSKLSELREGIKQELCRLEERVMEKFSVLSADISNMRGELKMLNEKYKKMALRCDDIENDVIENKKLISKIENTIVSSDLIISNIPDTIELNTVLGNIAKSLNCENITAKKIFRTKGNAIGKSSAIIVKLGSSDERVSLFRALALFRKTKNRQLCLSDIGLQGNVSVNINECLSTYNKYLLNSALTHKRNKLLKNVFTLRGNVYVRVKADANAIKVVDIKELNRIVSGM